MLAAERRPEMGMARAVGQQRRQLIQQFIAEGSGYALLSGLVGAAVGVAVTYALGSIFGGIVGDFFTVEPVVTPRSAIIGYCLGVVITYAAIVASSFRASRLNVVAAVRDLPDVGDPTRKRRTLVSAVLMVAVGALFAVLGQTGEVARAFLFYGGVSLLPFGLARLARYVGAPARPVFTVVGLYILILWLLPGDWSRRLFGDLGGDFEMFFLSGIFMVAGATILVVQNLDLLLGAVSHLGRLFESKLPAIRTALSYPNAARGRTGMTIAMFSLIVFSMVTFATISENFANLFLSDEADAGWDVQVEVASANQLPNKDLPAALAAMSEAPTGAGMTVAELA
jgi:putative ABC transport system permease protein